MQGTSWVAMLRRIPPAQQDCTVLVTTTATEIHLQNIVRLEKEYVVVRARLGGSQDMGRIMFVPYDQINYVALTKQVSEAVVHTLLGKPGVTVQLVENGEVVDDPAPSEAVVETPPAEEPAAAKEEAPAPQAEPKPPPKPVHPSKSVLLARLRARLASEPGKPAEP
jgi:hypothetical protein